VLCNLLGAEMDRGELPADRQLVGSMVANICFANACAHFRLELDLAWDAWSRRVEAP
jgi:glucuronate isomerase